MNLEDPKLLEAINAKNVKPYTKKIPISKKKEEIKKEEPEKLIKVYKENSARIELVNQSKYDMEKDFENKNYNLRRIAGDEKRIIDNWQLDEETKLKDHESKQIAEIEIEEENLKKDVTKLDRIIYFLKRKDKKTDFKPKEVNNNRDRSLEILETYKDDYLHLVLFLAENDRPVNKFTLFIIGNCVIGGRGYQDLDTKILELPDDYISLNEYHSGYNLRAELKHFRSDVIAKLFHKNNNLQSLMRDFLREYNQAIDEFKQVIQHYNLNDFKEIIEVEKE